MKRWFLRAALMISVGLSSFSLSSAGALAASNAKATTWLGKGDCGSAITAPYTPIGFVNFHRVGNTVSVSLNYHLKDAPPNTTFSVSLWGAPCFPIAFFGNVTTNSDGVVNGTFETPVPPTQTQFFAASFAPSTGFNDTTTVTLLP